MEFFATCNGIPIHISDSKKGEKTLLVLGMHDYHIPMEKANLLIDLLPKAEKLVLEHSGHIGFLEEPEIVQKKLLDFLNIE